MTPQPSYIPRPGSAASGASARSLDDVMHAVASGDQSALARLYDATCAYVHGVAVRVLGDAHAAEEVTVEVYHRAWHRAMDYDPKRGGVAAWLMTMARSRSIDRLRARVSPRTESLIEQAVETMDPRPGPDVAVQLADRSANIRQALRSLRPEQQEVIELAFFEGLSHGAIARRLELPLGTVKTRIRVGVRRLAERLRPLEEPR